MFFKNTNIAEGFRRHGTMPSLIEQEKKLNYVSTMTLLAAIAYSAFLPLKLGSGWFYAGLILYLLGLVFGLIAIINFGITSLDKPVINGVYRISRNPMYFGMFVIFIGISVASASWLFTLLTIIWLILADRGVIAEERWCLETYKDVYKEYMNRPPRWIGVPKSMNDKS
ncbi:methyltransferase family protein [Thermoproteota archaeon]